MTLVSDLATVTELQKWAKDNHEVVLDLIRAYLGIGLFVRGILFITDAQGVQSLVNLSDFSLLSGAVVHYVTFAHLFGGLLLAVGLLTRIAALLQIPVLMGALFLVHWEDGLLAANQSLEFSALVLFLLVVVFLLGAGRWSADFYVFVREPELHAEEEFETWWRPAEDERKPIATSSREETDVPENVRAEPEGEAATCSCGHGIDHPQVTVEPRYGWSAGFFFMLGISAPVKEVIFYCQECGTVIKRSRDPKLRRRYRWHTS